jgi:DNA-binding NarL/FixJ family response regulator
VSATILLADDHPLVRRGLRQVLERELDLEVVAEVADGNEAVARATELAVDLAILDVSMPGLSGLQAAAQLAKQSPNTRVLILSMYDNAQYVLAAARAGAAGYLLKQSADEEVVNACRAALQGGSFIAPDAAGAAARAQLATAVASGEPELTVRELEVLRLVAEGRSSREISQQLVISVKTVDRHRANIMDKLGVRDRVQLSRYAIRAGLIDP